MGRWGDLTGVGFLHLGKTWDEPEGEEKKNNEQAMQRGLGGFPHERLHQDNDNNGIFSYPPHPTPHTPRPTPDEMVYLNNDTTHSPTSFRWGLRSN
ncbi:MAG: hypothetical protein F6K26_29500 [Moorea sp. SIO2I5]|nr:hypothetical protein [Moorena sp. SIO2I5]